MAKVKIKKISVIALQKDQERVLSILQRLGCAEFLNIKEKLDNPLNGEDPGKLKDRQNDFNFTINFLSRFQDNKKSIFEQKPQYSIDEMKEIIDCHEVEDTVISCRNLENRLNELKSNEMKLKNTMDNLKPWQSLNIPVKELGATKTTLFQTGTIPEKNREIFQQKAAGLTTYYLQEISRDTELIYLLLAFHRDIEEQMAEILSETGWGRQDLPEINGIPAEGIASIENQLIEIEKEREAIEKEAVELTRHTHLIEVAYDYYTILIERESARQNLAATKKIFNLEGWVPETEMTRVSETLKENIDGIYLDFLDPEEDEDVPIVLSNPGFVEPYELITNLYSPPGKNDLDPNIFMVPFFFLFFGMMISDAGYGIILAVYKFPGLEKD